jgi:hypothetical protein
MTFLRTKIRDIGDILTEQTTIEHAGEFVIETQASKLSFPVLTNISQSISTSITQTSASIPTVAFEHRWTDLIGSFDDSTGTTALTFEEYLTNGMSYYFFRNDQNDTFSPKFQMPHSWAKTNVRPHIHVAPCADPLTPQVVTFGYQVQWLSLTGSFSSTWTTGSVNVTINPGDINKHVKVSLIDFPPLPQPSASDFLLMRIMRSGSSALDTYTTAKPGVGTNTANLLFLACDCHIQQSTAGTVNEY